MATTLDLSVSVEPPLVEDRAGDILKIRERDAVVCQQVNCVATKPHGLSASFVKAYGKRADVYGQRIPISKGRNTAHIESRPKPGQIIYVPPGGENVDEPAIAHLVGQYMYGKCGNQSYRFTNTGETEDHQTLKLLDNPRNREKNFETCLKKLAERVRNDASISTVYFPQGIGCGLAGGNWSGAYRPMIERFVEDISSASKRVVILNHLSVSLTKE